MHNPESVLENETQKIPWDFEKHTDPVPNIGQTTRYRNNQQRELAEL